MKKQPSSNIGFLEGLLMFVGVIFAGAVIFVIIYIADISEKKMKVSFTEHGQECRKAYIYHSDFNNCILPVSYRKRY